MRERRERIHSEDVKRTREGELSETIREREREVKRE